MGDPDEKAWIRNRIEGPEKNISFTENGKKAILNKIIQIFGIIVIACGILFLLSLITYSPDDPHFIFSQN